MDYHEAADFLFDLRRFKVKPGVEATRDLLSHLDDPQEGLTVVQVGGSNGKGSAARMTESILRSAGYDVGLYTSPHLDDMRERVRVDGRKIPEAALARFVAAAEPFLTERAATGEGLTFFETLTAMALWHFDHKDVDVAVLEVGMGGEYDATSAVEPTVAAVTNVSLEHTDVLGDTVEEIARTKSKIAPEGRPLVTGATGDALTAVRDTAGDVVTVAEADDGDPDVTVTYGGRASHTESAVSLAGADWTVEARLPMLGEYQAHNAGIAATLARQVTGSDGVLGDGTPVSSDTIARGLRSAHWAGRFEIMNLAPLTVLDGAHNPDACEALGRTLSEFDYDDLHLIFASMHDKNYRSMAAALPPAATVTTCRPDLQRAEDPKVLRRAFERAVGDATEVRSVDAVAEAVRRATSEAGEDDAVVVLGSLYAVAEARTALTRLEIPKQVRSLSEATRVLADANVPDDRVMQVRDDGVHRVLKTRVQRRQATVLKEELLALGGECAIAGTDNDGELLDTVLMGTLATFERLIERLQERPYGLAGIGEGIRESLELGVASGEAHWPWSDRTAVMGILNVTPDSFHDGGRYQAVEDAVARAETMVEDGADIIDIGGESTRPGADPVSVEEEKRRVVPVIEELADLNVLISVDTRRAEVGEAALDAGADILNDVTGLEDPGMRFLAADRGVPIVVMHSIEAPVNPDRDVEYDDVVEDVIEELAERVLLAEKAGVPREHIIVDPGLGFGKSRSENFELLGRVEEFEALGCPILVGHSHKSMFGLVDGAEGGDHPAGTIAGSAIAADRGADILRVHDVAENVAAVRTAEAAVDPEAFGGE